MIITGRSNFSNVDPEPRWRIHVRNLVGVNMFVKHPQKHSWGLCFCFWLWLFLPGHVQEVILEEISSTSRERPSAVLGRTHLTWGLALLQVGPQGKGRRAAVCASVQALRRLHRSCILSQGGCVNIFPAFPHCGNMILAGRKASLGCSSYKLCFSFSPTNSCASGFP